MKTYIPETEKADNLIDLRGAKGGRLEIRIGGKLFDTIDIQKQHPELHGLPNKKETKRAVIADIIKGSDRLKIKELMSVITPEDLVHLFLNIDEYKKLAKMTKENLDSDPHNKLALANDFLEKIIKPYGLEFKIENKLVGMDITINFNGQNHKIK